MTVSLVISLARSRLGQSMLEQAFSASQLCNPSQLLSKANRHLCRRALSLGRNWPRGEAGKQAKGVLG